MSSRIQEMRTMRSVGLTFKEIGARFKVSGQRVQQILARDEDYERRGERFARRKAATLEMFKRGMDYEIIAERLGISVSRVKVYLWMEGGVKRMAPKRGTSRAWLTADQVRKIRGLFGKIRNVAIAKRFGVTRAAITEIAKRRRHASVK